MLNCFKLLFSYINLHYNGKAKKKKNEKIFNIYATL